MLFISLSNVGDAVMTTPALEVLHAAYPEALIDIVADRRSAQLFEHCPYRGGIFFKEKRQGWRGLLRLIQDLRRIRYEIVVDLRTDGLAYLLRARRRLTKWSAAKPEGHHAVQQLMTVVAPLNPDGAVPDMRIWLDQPLRDFARRAVAELPGRRWLALGPGAKWSAKIWPAERFAELQRSVPDLFDAAIILGSPGDIDYARAVERELQVPTLNLAGQTTILEDCAVLQHSAALVGNDSGLGHLAVALGVPTVTVFGPTDPKRYRPWGSRSVCVVAPDGRLAALPAATVAARLRSLLLHGPDGSVGPAA